MQNNLENYWNDLDSRLEKLIEYGAVKLPSLKQFHLEKLSTEISDEMKGTTFKELSSAHKDFLNYIDINKYLVPKLFEVAKKLFNYKGDMSNQYHIARRVEPGNSKEMYRAHFDSHLFTMVLPIKIPNVSEKGISGELIYFPKIRKMPTNEINNMIGKVYYKKYASKTGIEKLSNLHQKYVENFADYEPLLFFGKTTLHTNYPVLKVCESYRLTLLSHFFDDSPQYGVGGFMRMLRRR